MKIQIMATALICLLLTGIAVASHDKGKTLHDTGCTGCHDTSVYTRSDRIIKSAEALDKRVRMCESAGAKNWSTEQIDDVIHYLDATFYKFGSDRN